ncbi:MAG: VWA domain-containing protein, partial [Acidobacteriota bacterium]
MGGQGRILRTILPAVALASLCTTSVAETAPPEDAASALAPESVAWLELVDLLITDQERAYFLQIDEDFRRRAFIARFWQERDPDPLTPFNELRDQWEERAAWAQSRYPTLLDERAQVYLLQGEPFTYCIDKLRELETWYYEISEDDVFPITFYALHRDTPYRIRVPSQPSQPALRSRPIELAVREMCGQTNPELQLKTIRLTYRGKQDYDMALDAFLVRPDDPPSEWVATFASRGTALPSDAAMLAADLDVAFPGRHQQRTVLEGIATIPAAALRLTPPPASGELELLLTGELVRNGELFDTFRYRFAISSPADDDAGKVPLVFQRYLRPGPVRLLLKIEDLVGRRFAHLDRHLEVPRVDQAAILPQNSELGRLLQEAHAAAAAGQHSLRLVPPPQALLAGLVRFEILAAGAFDHVRFFLDDRPLLSKRKPPYSVEIDLGKSPMPHLLRVAGFDAAGAELADDELLLSPGGQRFHLRLSQPRQTKTYYRSVPVAVDLQVPEGRAVERVEIFVDQHRVATLYQEPYAQPIVLPRDYAMAFVRAVAYLDDGSSTEDVVFVNSPIPLDEVEVRLVEVPVAVHDRQGRSVAELAPETFTLLEDGEPQTLRRVEWVDDLPIHASLLLDVSSSMMDHLEAVAAAARTFAEQTLRPRDRLALIVFNDRQRVVTPFTHEPATIRSALETLRAEGGTALYDSLVFAAQYFFGVKGQKALLLLSDGEDEASRFGADEALETA